jgi:apolipoprotein N-acyltransferase
VLVPGGEYTPLGDLLPPLRWARNLVAVIPELDPGPADQEPLTLIPAPDPGSGRPIRAGTVLCFEMLSPAPCRARRAAGADVLLNPSNYGWFGRTTFRAQLRAVARLRAAETATTIVVAGNTGPTLFYDPLGRPYGRFQPVGDDGEGTAPGAASAGAEGAVTAGLERDALTYRLGFAVAPLLVDPEPTPYVWWGDLPWFGLGLLLLGFGLFTPRARDVPVTERGYLNTC